MGRPKKTQPSYLEHKPSGQARVRIDGQDYYLGPYKSPESWTAYYALLSKLANGETKPAKPKLSVYRGLRIDELVAHYLDHCTAEHGLSWKHTKWKILSPTTTLVDLFGDSPANDFSPLKLQRTIEQIAINGNRRPALIKKGRKEPLTAPVVNDYLQSLKRMFRWAVSQELVPAAVYQALETVEGIKPNRGRQGSLVRKAGKVKPVTQEQIDAVLPHLGPEISAMVQVQRLAGMRPDEVTIMRPCDIDRGLAASIWIYRPPAHKTDWLEGHDDKQILLGPKSQQILTPFIQQCSDPEQYLFSPRTAVARALAKQTEGLGRDRARAANLAKLQQVRPARDHYDDASYAQAVQRACRRAKIEEWTPGRLRHTAATEIRARYGAEAAKLVLGHRHLSTTEIYAEKNLAKYAEIISAMG